MEEMLSDGTFPSTVGVVHGKHTEASTPLQGNRRRPRLGFKKTRSGCYGCKHRRIKCQENRPACNNCIKRQINCRYPPESVSSKQVTRKPSLQFSLSEARFDSTDMRLFHHYLTTAYPALPLGNDRVWVTDIAALTHSYSFLIHAVLGLAASHLCLTSTSRLGTEALSHRVIAIRELNAAFSKSPKSSADSDAIVATCYALAMQTGLIGESVEEFLIMLRGCRLVTAQNWVKTSGTCFKALSFTEQVELASERLTCLPRIPENQVSAAKMSLEQLRAFCVNGVSLKVFSGLSDLVLACEYSSREAYFKYFELFTIIGTLPEQEFQTLINHLNPLMQILLAHFITILVMIYPIKAMEWDGRDLGKPNRNMLFRLDGIIANVPTSMHKFLEWPRLIASSVELGLSFPNNGSSLRQDTGVISASPKRME